VTTTASTILRSIASLIILLGTITAIGSASAQESGDAPRIDPENILLIDTEYGRIAIQMAPQIAPRHVARIKQLAREGFYDGVVFHRVIDGFMAQTGDPSGTGAGGSDLPDLPAEFSPVPHQRGIVSMARARDPNSANSQFFIMLADSPPNADGWSQLDEQYTVWGAVISGMEHVDRIAKGEPPANPDRMIRVRVAADLAQGREYPMDRSTAERLSRPDPNNPRLQAEREVRQQRPPPASNDIISPVLKNPKKDGVEVYD